MTINNNTPYAAEWTLVSDRNGALVWVVVVQGTFDIHPDGSVTVAEKQADICRAPEYSAEPGRSSLIYDTDMVLTKPTTDILIHAHARAPGGKPATTVDVTMKVGKTVKTLRVTGDRMWEQTFAGLRMTDPKPFLKMPIVYERAYGGGDAPNADAKNLHWDRRNPVGTGYARNTDDLAGKPVPNVEDPDAPLSRVRIRTHPVGFGPIGPDWIPRANFAGTYDEEWEKRRLPLLPLDFDDRFYQSAPPDQQSRGYLKGGEEVVLLNMTPGGILRFRLPRVWLSFHTVFVSESVQHHAHLHSVKLEPDVPRVCMVWHTSVPCHGKETKLERTTVVEKQFSSPRA